MRKLKSLFLATYLVKVVSRNLYESKIVLKLKYSMNILNLDL